MASSKVKSSSSSSASQAGTLISSSVSSAGQADIFNDLFDKMHVEEMSSQADAGQQQSKNNNNEEMLQTKPTDKNDETVAATSSKKTDKDEDELSSEEKKELDEIENYKMSMEELAKQLNVALTVTPMSQPVENKFQEVKIVFTGQQSESAQLKSALESIDPKLLRMVDVQTLDAQLKKLVKNGDVLDVEVPESETSDVAEFSELPEMLPEEAVAPDEMQTLLTSAAEEIVEAQPQQLGLEEASSQEMEFDSIEEVEENQDVEDLDIDLDALGAKDEKLDVKKSKENFDQDLKKLAQHSEFDLKTVKSQKNADSEAVSSWAQANSQNTVNHQAASSKTDPLLGLNQIPQNPVNSGTVNSVKTSQKLSSTEIQGVKQQVQTTILELSRNEKSETTRIQMNPEHLGRIEIKIEMKDKSVKAEIVTDNPDAKEAILHHMPQIKAALASENMMLDYFSAKHDEKHFQFAQGSNADSEGRSKQGGTSSRNNPDSLPEAAQLKSAIQKRLNSNSLINITV